MVRTPGQQQQGRWVTLVEVGSFLRDIGVLLSDHEIEQLYVSIAANPSQGVIVPGTGGVRKIRWAAKGKGKRGGARVIYLYHDEGMPTFLLAAYAKDRKADLSKAERNHVKRLVTILIKEYYRRS